MQINVLYIFICFFEMASQSKFYPPPMLKILSLKIHLFALASSTHSPDHPDRHQLMGMYRNASLYLLGNLCPCVFSAHFLEMYG